MSERAAHSGPLEMIIPASKKTPYYPALDGFRTIAVGAVFVVHYMPPILPYGWLGVQMFFVLSGFLITGILADTSSDRFRFKNFYVRRALRIFPLYYGVLTLWACISLLTHGSFSRYYLLWPVYLQNFFWLITRGSVSDVLFTGSGHAFAMIGHLWSLAVEEQFYLLWPLVVFAVRDRKRLMQVCCALIALRLGLAAYWQTYLTPATLSLRIIYTMLPTQWDGFLMGGLLALWLRGKPSPHIQARSGIIAAGAVLFYGGLLALVHLRPELIRGQNAFDFRSGFQATIGMPLCNLASVLVILAILRQGTWAYRICNLAPMRSLGRVSYGLYIYHMPMWVLCAPVVDRLRSRFTQGDNSVGHAMAATCLTVVVSYASYYLFEKHFLLLKNRFTSIQSPKEKSIAAHGL